MLRTVLRWALAVAMMGVGVLHFGAAPFFTNIVPSWLPFPLLLVYVSGVFEVGFGLGLLMPKARRWAGLGLIALYVAVFPANINMALHPELGGNLPHWALYARLPFQALFIAWAWWVSRIDPPASP